MPEIIGIIRFSFVSSETKQFEVSRGRTEEEIAATLLSDARLVTRFHLFEKYTLPSIRSQKDQDFSIIILASSLLSEAWRQRLEAGISGAPQISIRYGKPQKLALFIKDSLPTLSADQWRVTFRLDDDDGLSTNYISLMREIARPSYRGMCVSLPKVVQIEDNGTSALFYPEWKAKHSAGLAYIGEIGEERSIYQIGNHTRVDERCLMITDSREFSALRLFHSYNDHQYRETIKRKVPLERDRFERRIGHGFSYLFD